ncbi:MAG: hypothetical protein MUO40_13985 [Anaerolineaceae bacterium]|nr:hypothetical protein [Anaerolineaceae bacterium]
MTSVQQLRQGYDSAWIIVAVLCSVPCIAGVLYNKGIAIGKIPPIFEKIVVVIVALLILYWFLSAVIGWMTYFKKRL